MIYKTGELVVWNGAMWSKPEKHINDEPLIGLITKIVGGYIYVSWIGGSGEPTETVGAYLRPHKP